MSNWPIKKLGEIILVILLVLVILFPFVYIYLFRPNSDFWDSTMSNLLATGLALIAGIPIALWIDRKIKSKEEIGKYNEERRRELQILKLVQEELDFSLNSLFLPTRKGNLNTLNKQPLKSDLWNAFIAGEEIKFIENPKLLNRIVSAYYVLNIVRNIEMQAYKALRFATVYSKQPDGSEKTSAQLLIEDARYFDELFEVSLNEALKMINERLSELKKYEK
jgi:hypothetical protein